MFIKKNMFFIWKCKLRQQFQFQKNDKYKFMIQQGMSVGKALIDAGCSFRPV